MMSDVGYDYKKRIIIYSLCLAKDKNVINYNSYWNLNIQLNILCQLSTDIDDTYVSSPQEYLKQEKEYKILLEKKTCKLILKWKDYI